MIPYNPSTPISCQSAPALYSTPLTNFTLLFLKNDHQLPSQTTTFCASEMARY
ncbi:unnamed protein product [Staurois parvus]|uniref:Uncharacterized protein n=1 Tax=Staurois parvus TaxID=386267 RepID=A0ABN9EUJ1_9NEOB|nr:unnamed protein product [Staurois parvus]